MRLWQVPQDSFHRRSFEDRDGTERGSLRGAAWLTAVYMVRRTPALSNRSCCVMCTSPDKIILLKGMRLDVACMWQRSYFKRYTNRSAPAWHRTPAPPAPPRHQDVYQLPAGAMAVAAGHCIFRGVYISELKGTVQHENHAYEQLGSSAYVENLSYGRRTRSGTIQSLSTSPNSSHG